LNPAPPVLGMVLPYGSDSGEVIQASSKAQKCKIEEQEYNTNHVKRAHHDQSVDGGNE
jgi:hypothetical protein